MWIVDKKRNNTSYNFGNMAHTSLPDNRKLSDYGGKYHSYNPTCILIGIGVSKRGISYLSLIVQIKYLILRFLFEFSSHTRE